MVNFRCFRGGKMRNNPDDLANQKLEKIREWCLINARYDWDSADAREEFQAIVNLIDEEEGD